MVFYRAHELSGNTGFVDALCQAIADRGAVPLPVYCASLRSADAGLTELLAPAQAVITTVLAAGGSGAAGTSAEGDWDAGALATLGVPILQGLCLTSSRAQWQDADGGLSPIDAAMQVAIPEFDGRLITVPFSFKEEGPDGIGVYVADPERARRLAGIAVRQAKLAGTPNSDKRVAIMLSSYPTKNARVGNAVGLDTPASAVRLLQALRAAGYDLGDGFPEDGDTLIHTLIAAGGYDTEWLTEQQLSAAPARAPLARYRQWLDALPESFTRSVIDQWGEPPGELYTDDGDLVFASLRFGHVVVMIQPPRGFGENPVAIYHDPVLPPSHHYLAAYRWLDHEFGVDAIIHLGKHGTLEWLPGKGLGLSAQCGPDAVLQDLPLVYPFIVNDPGEGTQAKRRGHAVIVDHLVPPMARADSYGELAKLEQLLDEYATVAALDPDKLPTVRAQIWSMVRAAQLHHDLGVAGEPGAAEFDDFVLHIDGYLCEVKDASIRDGLHILGAAPEGEALLNLVLVILRSAQLWSARWGALPGLRAALGLLEGGDASRTDTDRYEQTARALIEAMAAADWDPDRATEVAAAALTAASAGDGHAGRADRPAGRPGGRHPRPPVRLHRGRAPAGRDQRRDRRRADRAVRRLRARGSVRVAHPRPGQRAADRPELLLGRPEGHPVTQLLGHRAGAGRLAAGPAPGRRGRLPAVRRAHRVGHLGHADPGRRHRRGAGPDRLPPGMGRDLAPGHRVRRRAGR